MVRNMVKNNKGFTLVELLVVVAIVGILATAGIPQYRRMVQKSRKAEPKVMLSAVYNAQAAFFSEFGSYGSNLQAMGMDDASNGAQSTYETGFTTAACAAAMGTGSGGSGAFPLSTSTIGITVNTANPTFYAGGASDRQIFGKPRTANCRAVLPASLTNSQFVAASSGTIAPGVDPLSGASDQWEINHTRSLSNVVDGVK